MGIYLGLNKNGETQLAVEIGPGALEIWCIKIFCISLEGLHFVE